MIILGLEGKKDAESAALSSGPAVHLVLVFGVGMIGHAITTALQRLGFRQYREVAWPWDEAPARALAGPRLLNACEDFLQGRQARLSVLWSAGRAGFHSNAAELEPENLAFSDTLSEVEKLRNAIGATSLDLHYMSSAGGLFEGQQVIDLTSRALPLRPYGDMKLGQEKLLAETFAVDQVAIYRPSSVYGPYFRGSRHGLINHLVENTRHGRVTVLDAHVAALRDYVFTGDIGRFVGRNIRFGLPPGASRLVHFLVSGRCASIFEVVRKIERVLRRKVPFRLDEYFGNHRNITFNERVLPPNWHPSSLEVGLRQFLMQPAD